MFINTYDQVDKATYDIRGLEEHFQSCIKNEENKRTLAIAKAEAYCNGFREAMFTISGIMGASNYRAKETVETESQKLREALEKIRMYWVTSADTEIPLAGKHMVEFAEEALKGEQETKE